MSIISTVPKGAAVEGINPNLLRNWYFVGGGTGRGVFPVNSRGITSGTITSGGFTIDNWNIGYGSGGATFNLNANYLEVGPANASSYVIMAQQLPVLSGKMLTGSILLANNTLLSSSFSRASGQEQYFINGSEFKMYINSHNGFVIRINSSPIQIQAVKVEFGDQQTLCYQEGGIWKLNELPNYDDELERCKLTSLSADDPYAQQQVGNITVQCNSVGSSSLRYYNKLIQSTHKVLDSTFSNPAAQTSDITVTTYDGYLDFSNGFASGATTNITLVLGTSGPVLSTSTTAPS